MRLQDTVRIKTVQSLTAYLLKPQHGHHHLRNLPRFSTKVKNIEHQYGTMKKNNKLKRKPGTRDKPSGVKTIHDIFKEDLIFTQALFLT